MTILCREAGPDDLDGLLELYRHLSPEDPPLSVEDARASFHALLVSDMTQVLVAEFDGEMSATCLLLIVPNLTRGGRPFAVVENVVTLAEHRRKGLGMALMKAAQDRAWAANCYKIMIATGRKDEGVLRFYEEAGFKRGGKTFFEARRLG